MPLPGHDGRGWAATTVTPGLTRRRGRTQLPTVTAARGQHKTWTPPRRSRYRCQATVVVKHSRTRSCGGGSELGGGRGHLTSQTSPSRSSGARWRARALLRPRQTRAARATHPPWSDQAPRIQTSAQGRDTRNGNGGDERSRLGDGERDPVGLTVQRDELAQSARGGVERVHVLQPQTG